MRDPGLGHGYHALLDFMARPSLLSRPATPSLCGLVYILFVLVNLKLQCHLLALPTRIRAIPNRPWLRLKRAIFPTEQRKSNKLELRILHAPKIHRI